MYRKQSHGRLKEKTPQEVHRQPIRTPDNLEVTSEKRTLFEGKVHFIREALEDSSISVLIETYPVQKAEPNNGVWATLNIKKDGSWLHVFDAAPDVRTRKLLASFSFEIDELVASHSASDELPIPTRSIDGYSIDKILSYNTMS